eukprot:EG_transcript_10902
MASGVDLNTTECCNVYITNLPPTVTLRTFRDAFTQAGVMVSARIVPRRKGFAPVGFVQYVDPSMAQAAIALFDGQSLEGSVLSVALARRNKDKGIENAPSLRLYVANLPTFYAEQDVAALFGLFGPIQWLKLVRHRYSGASKGAALVHFATFHAACAAKEAMHYRLMETGMLLDVKFAESADERLVRKAKPSTTAKPRRPPHSPAASSASSASSVGSSAASSVGSDSGHEHDPSEADASGPFPESWFQPPRRRWSF